MKMQLATWTLSASLMTVPALAADVVIEQLAPESSIFVVGATNVRQSLDHLKKTPLWDMIMSEELRQQREDMMEEFTKGIDEMVEELGVDRDTIQMPTGPGGMALYTAMDEELATSFLAVIASLDYGDNADKTYELLEAALAKAEDDQPGFSYDVGELNGHPMFSINLPEKEDDMNREAEFAMGPAMPDMRQVFGDIKAVHIVRCDSTFLFGSDKVGLTSAVETLDGDAGASMADRGDFQAIKGMLDASPDMYMVLTMKGMNRVVGMLDSSGMSAMVMPTVEAFFGDIQGFGSSTRIDGATAMMEGTHVVYMPNGKSGLPALFDHETGIGKVPSFVSSDAISYSRINMKFGEMKSFLKDVIDATPLLKMQAPPEALEQFLTTVESITSPLGAELHSVQLARKPLTKDSMASFIAMDCPDPQKFENAMNDLAAQMGMEPRDFIGHRIYSMDMSGMNPMGGGGGTVAIGIGGQMVFIGEGESVENGLRAIGNDGEGGLSTITAFTRAMGVVDADEVVAWGYADLPTSMEASIAKQKIAQAEMIEQYREWDPALADEMEAEFKDAMGPIDNVDWDFVSRYLGPAAWVVRSRDNGFVMRTYVLSGNGDN
ncbi:MAG: hypothetical protein KC983_02755 [Phycisphaerales bacterium]|nr:hypothetical protein [Phycisphaerales bacterium]